MVDESIGCVARKWQGAFDGELGIVLKRGVRQRTQVFGKRWKDLRGKVLVECNQLSASYPAGRLIPQ